MAFRIMTSLKPIVVHSNSIVKARAKAAEHVSKRIDPACDVLNGLSGPYFKTRAGRVLMEYGRLHWLSGKDGRFVAEYLLNKNGTLGKQIRRF